MKARDILLSNGFKSSEYLTYDFMANEEVRKELEIYKLSFEEDGLIIYHDCNDAKLTIEIIKAIYKWYLDNGKIEEEVKMVYGYPVEQIILWAELIRQTGIDSKELKDKTDLVKLGYELCKEEYTRSMNKVAEQFANNMGNLK